MDKFLIVSGAFCVILLGFIVGAYITNLKPEGKQNSSLLALVIVTSILFGLVGWVLALIGFKGNPSAQLQFLLAFVVLVLFPVTVTTASVSASQLYGLRETVAASLQCPQQNVA